MNYPLLPSNSLHTKSSTKPTKDVACSVKESVSASDNAVGGIEVVESASTSVVEEVDASKPKIESTPTTFTKSTLQKIRKSNILAIYIETVTDEFRCMLENLLLICMNYIFVLSNNTENVYKNNVYWMHTSKLNELNLHVTDLIVFDNLTFFIENITNRLDYNRYLYFSKPLDIINTEYNGVRLHANGLDFIRNLNLSKVGFLHSNSVLAALDNFVQAPFNEFILKNINGLSLLKIDDIKCPPQSTPQSTPQVTSQSTPQSTQVQPTSTKIKIIEVENDDESESVEEIDMDEIQTTTTTNTKPLENIEGSEGAEGNGTINFDSVYQINNYFKDDDLNEVDAENELDLSDIDPETDEDLYNKTILKLNSELICNEDNQLSDKINIFEDYLFIPNLDFYGNDMHSINPVSKSIKEYKFLADKDPECIGFNTWGYFKQDFGNICFLRNQGYKVDGFYVKRSALLKSEYSNKFM